MQKSLCLAVTLVAALAVTASAGVVVDNFNNGSVNYSGPGASNEPAVAGTLGGNRATALSSGLTAMEINEPAPPVDSTGFLAFGNDPGIAGTMTLTYTASPGVDLTNGGLDDRVRFRFLSSDQPATLTLELEDSAANLYTVAKGVAIGPHDEDIFLSDYVLAGVDVTDIVRAEIQLTPNNTLGGDYFLDIIESANENGGVPEPAGLVLLSGGLFGLVARKRRK